MYFILSEAFGIIDNFIYDKNLYFMEKIYLSTIKNKFHFPNKFSNQRLSCIPTY